jgi:hypothetical protein
MPRSRRSHNPPTIVSLYHCKPQERTTYPQCHDFHPSLIGLARRHAVVAQSQKWSKNKTMGDLAREKSRRSHGGVTEESQHSHLSTWHTQNTCAMRGHRTMRGATFCKDSLDSEVHNEVPSERGQQSERSRQLKKREVPSESDCPMTGGAAHD